MRATSQALIAFLDGLRSQRDSLALVADCYTFILQTGLILTYTSADVPIALNGAIFAANSVLVDGLTFKCEVGLQVDQQQITLAAQPTDTIGGIPFLQAIRNGILDGAEVQRERAFLTSWTEAPVGSVVLFKGRVGTVDSVGRTSAKITVNSDLVLLDVNMPRNLYAPNCQHVLYDSGCGLIKNAHGAKATAGGGSTQLKILWSGSSSVYAQGTLTFSSGVNTGATANVKSADAATLYLSAPLLNVPAAGDAFTVYQGCDHTQATCQAKFGNVANFRGFPYVPPPTYAL